MSITRRHQSTMGGFARFPLGDRRLQILGESAIFGDRQAFGIIVNTWREIPPQAMYPVRGRNSQLEAVLEHRQEAFDLSQEPRTYVSSDEPIHIYNPADFSTWTSELGGAPAGWRRTSHNHALGNDETGFLVTGFDGKIAAASPGWGYFAIYLLTEEEEGSGAAISYDVSISRRHFVAKLSATGEVIFGASPNTNPLAFSFETSTFDSVDWICIRSDKGRRTNRVQVWTEEGGVIYSRYTENEGATYSVATSIASGKKPAACIDEDNRRYLYWIDGTAIKGQIYDANDTVLEATFTAVASGVDDNGIAVDCRTITGGRRQIILWYVASGTVTAVYSDDGKTFA